MLGVARSASEGDIRRAFRKLALSLHPDRAGAESKAAFQRVAEAYAVLSDPEARACHDRAQLAREAAAAVHAAAEIARAGGPSPASAPSSLSPKLSLALRLDAAGRLLPRLSASLEALVAREDARHDGDVIELYLEEDERQRGGVALIDVELRVRCSLSVGTARPGGFSCFRC